MLIKFAKVLAKLQAVVLALVLVASAFPGAVDATEIDPPTNPPLEGSCGLDIVLVMDTSSSITGDSDSGELDQMQTALQGFVSALASTPSVFALVSFDDTAVTQEAFMADAATVSAAIEATDGSGATNWDDALEEAAANFDPRIGKSNLIIFASDGNPTVNNDSNATGGTTDGADLSNAVAEADALKAGGTRIITVGIGASVSQANMEAISSADAYYSAEDFGDLGDTLDDIATELCGGTLNVQKLVDTGEGTVPGEGWSFTVNQSEYQTGAVTGSFSVEATAGSYSVTEVSQPGYELVSASCVNGQDQSQGVVDLETMTVSGIEVDDQEIVSCTFVNAPTEVPDDSATIYATKIVCEDESYLPNWGDHAPVTSIDSSTATAFLNEVNLLNDEDGSNDREVCWTESWDFEWAYGDETNPGDNDLGFTGDGWFPFVNGTAVIPEPEGADFWVREVLPDGGWLGFTGQNTDQDVSAEIYCSADVLNYDNFDRLDNVVDDGEYYCVAFNVDQRPDEPQCDEGEYYDSELQECVPYEEEDACPNIEGFQNEVPDGYKLDEDNQCVSGGGGGGKKGRSGGGGGGNSNGEVLGAAACGPLLTQYLHEGWNNDKSEMYKLQAFLNIYLGNGLPLTGFFGPDTFAAVEQFQLKHGSEVLNPWVGFPGSGITGATTPTGFVYQTTRWQINNIWCPGSEAFPDTLI